jgi:hypothetical protein
MEENLFFEINDPAVDSRELMSEIRESIRGKEQSGLYERFALPAEALTDFLELRDDDRFMEYYLKVIRRTWAIDVNDFEIPAKEGISGRIELAVKKLIWKMLKFYTYRLFSQQIEFNSQVKNTLIAMHREYSRRLDALEKRLGAGENPPSPSPAKEDAS